MQRTGLVSLGIIAMVIITLARYAQVNGASTSHSTLTLHRQSQSIADIKHGLLAKAGGDLAELYQEHQDYLTRLAQGQDQPGTFRSSNMLIHTVQERVIVDAVANDEARQLQDDLQALGMDEVTRFGRIVSGQLPIDAIPNAAALGSLLFVRPSYAMTGVGTVTSQGDAAMKADSARSTFGVDGTGIKVGTLSDSYDCASDVATRAADDVVSGDLPSGVQVLREYSGNDCSDEGRGMMQLIHDVAPGADQLFYSAFEGGAAGFAQGIRALADAGADVIVDDVTYFSMPMFQDGIIAQAADEVSGRGTPYFSSSANYGRNSYESTYRAGPGFSVEANSWVASHDFDPGPGIDSDQQITLQPNGQLTLVLQWDSPFASTASGAAGSPNDIDILLLNSTATAVVARKIDNNIGGDAVEVLQYRNTNDTVTTYNIRIGKSDSDNTTPDPGLLKYVLVRLSGTIDEYATSSSTIWGHPNAAGASGVGAAFYADTPAFDQSPPLLEDFSSVGPTAILFDTQGNRLDTPQTRNRPNIVAPDGTNTTFFGDDSSADSDTFPNFFGTSAAAPHAAAVAALLLDLKDTLTPQQVYTALQSTAIDMETPGFDDLTGYGLIQADAALASIGSTPTFGVEVTPATDIRSGTPGTQVQYTLTIKNTGTRRDTFAVTVSGNIWTTSATPLTVGPLDVNAIATLNVAVTVPASASSGTSDSATVTVTSQGNTSVTDSARLTTTAQTNEEPVGDCNADGQVTSGDINAIVLRIFEGQFATNPGCDANNDRAVTAGDISCTVLLIFGNACSNGTAASTADMAGPELVLPSHLTTTPGGTVHIPVSLINAESTISSLVFALEYDEDRLHVDPTDQNQNTAAGAVQFTVPPGFSTAVMTNAAGAGRADFLVADLTAPPTGLPDGTFALITFKVAEGLPVGSELTVRLGDAVPASLGNIQGQHTHVHTTNKTVQIRVQPNHLIYLPFAGR